jgi:hypothetical protein
LPDVLRSKTITLVLYRVVLSAVPLMLDRDTRSHDFPRSWILPVLKSHVESTELGYFRDTLMPLASSLGAKGRTVCHVIVM